MLSISALVNTGYLVTLIYSLIKKSKIEIKYNSSLLPIILTIITRSLNTIEDSGSTPIRDIQRAQSHYEASPRDYLPNWNTIATV